MSGKDVVAAAAAAAAIKQMHSLFSILAATTIRITIWMTKIFP